MTKTRQSRGSIITLSTDERQKCVQRLRKKVAESQELMPYTLSDDFLLKFLYSRLFDVEVTFNLIKSYFDTRKAHPEMFLLPSQVIDVFERNILSLLPHRNVTGELLLVMRLCNFDPRDMDTYHLLAAGISFFERSAELEPLTREKGIIEVIDMRDVTWRAMFAMGPAHHRLAAQLNENALPIRFKRIHICYSSRFVSTCFAMLKPFLSKEIVERIVFHGSDLSQMYEEVPEHLLPPDLGKNAERTKFDTDVVKKWNQEVKDIWEATDKNNNV